MSEPVTALKNAAFAKGIAEVREIGPLGMITLRGDLDAAYLRKAATSVAGVGYPEQGQCTSQETQALAWMSPDELLLICAYADAPAKLAALTDKLGKQHTLAVNVSDARAVFELKGPRAREVLAKLAPVDLAPAAFGTGMFRRTRLAQVAAAFWMPEEDTFQIICFRSVAQYVFDLLAQAAQAGSEVDAF